MTDKANLTPAEVAADLRLSVRTVQRMIKNGQLAGIRTGEKKYIIPADALREFKARRSTRPATPTE